MVDIYSLSQEIRGLRDALEALEYRVGEIGEQARGFFAPHPHPTLVADWQRLVEAAARFALKADEFLDPRKPKD